MYKYFLFSIILVGVFFLPELKAQDTLKKKNIDITSSFKPMIREVSKIRFSATPLPAIISREVLPYQVKKAFWASSFSPDPVAPFILLKESTHPWPSAGFIRAGAGNIYRPFIEASISGTKDSTLRYYARGHFHAAKGGLLYQETSRTSIAVGTFFLDHHYNDWGVDVAYQGQHNWLYGFAPSTIIYSKDDLRNHYNSLTSNVYLTNAHPRAFGITYSPSLTWQYFSGRQLSTASEKTFIARLPVDKSLGSLLSFHLDATADITHYTKHGAPGIETKNELFSVNPAFLVKSPNIYLRAGLLPSWNQRIFEMLPDLLADVSTNDQRVTFMAGWLGYFNKGSFAHFTSQNPFLMQPDSLRNTRVREIYGGVKGSLGSHLSYTAKLSFLKQRNALLFANDAVDGKLFQVVYEPNMESLKLQGALQYTVGSSLQADMSVTYHQFTSLVKEKKPWGLIPLEFKSSFDWWILKDLKLHVQANIWEGPQYRSKLGLASKNEGAADLSAGVSFRIHERWDLWLQGNNILNTPYQRWNQYPSYGFNLVGGITYQLFKKP